MTKLRRICSIAIACAMLIASNNYSSAFAETSKETNASTEVVKDDTSTLISVVDGAELIPIDESMTDCKLLNYIDAEQFETSNYIYRVPSSEDLNSYAFVDSCGNKVVYIMDENTKYINADGEIVEKDLSLRSSENGYKVAENDIELLIPYDLSQGVTMKYLSYDISLLPSSISDKTTFEEINGSVIYSNAFNDNTTLSYVPVLSGFKESIIIPQYDGESSYDFTLKTNQLSAFNYDGIWYLAAEKDASEKFIIGNVDIYDAVGKQGTGSMFLSETDTDGEYTIRIMADESFLSDESTIYPVTIDPSITVSDNTHGANSIVDAPIFAGYPDSNFGGFVYDRIGTNSSTYGIGRTVVKLSGLINTTDYQNMVANQITDVKFYVREAAGVTSQSINVYPLNNSTWTETNVTWNNIGSHDTSVNYGSSMVSNQWNAFNITNLVKGWKNNIYSADAGFIFINSNESNDECFCSSEYSTTSYRPYVMVTYNIAGSGGGNSFDNATDITLNSSSSVVVAYSNEKRYFRFTAPSTGFFTFESSNIISGDPKAWLYNSLKEELISDDDGIGGSNRNFRLTYHLTSGAIYYLAAGCYSSGVGSYDFSVFYTPSPSYIKSVTNISNNSSTSDNISKASEKKYYSFTPTQSGYHLFFSSNRSGDPTGWIYNSSLSAVVSNDDGAYDLNYRLSAYLNANETYYIVSGRYGATVGSCTLNIYKPCGLNNAIYYIKNNGSLMYADVHGPTEQEFVHQYTFHTYSQESWTLQSQSDGCYTIRSHYGNQKYVGISNGSTGVDNIKLFSGISDDTKWKIYINTDKEYLIEPKNATGRVVLSPNNNVGTELRLCYLNEANSSSKWRFLQRDRNTVKIDTVYDQAYTGRNSDALNRINNNISKIQEKYLNDFEIWVAATSPTSFNSYADSCSTSYSSSCSHAADTGCYNSILYTNGTTYLYDYHHNNIYNTMLRIPFPDTDVSVKMAYIGHDNCVATRDSSGTLLNHSNNPYNGLTYSNIGLITVMNFNGASSETRTALHEFGHLYGAPDHYGGSQPTTEQIIESTGNTGFNSYCIYGENRESPSVLSDLTICDGCKSFIEANRNKYNH